MKTQSAPKQLLLINPRNPLVKLHDRSSRWNKYRVWKPLGLLVVAGLTPREWQVTVLDENVESPDYATLRRPDLVGITAFTSQAPRAYEIAAGFRARAVPVVMGGIHATVCQEEAAGRVDCIVTGEAESVWSQVIEDADRGALEPVYHGTLGALDHTPPARHDLLPTGYYFGSIQTTRGCPLNCSFCSVSAFNGRTYRRRPVADVVAEFKMIAERHVLVVDDNLIGTRRDHIARARELFRAMIEARLDKRWFCQATVNFADDDELLDLAHRAGCIGVFIGFETISEDGLVEIHKQYNIQKHRSFRDSVRRIQAHGITVAGSFIMGLEADRPGIGRRIAATARQYGLDFLNVLYLTPLPGTTLWDEMQEGGRVLAHDFPHDWQYFTLNHPVTDHRCFSQEEIRGEMQSCMGDFYSRRHVLQRTLRNAWRRCQPKLTLVGNLSYRVNGRATSRAQVATSGGLQGAARRPVTNGHLVASDR